MDIFNEVPSGFHHRFTETINEISGEFSEKEMRKVKRLSIKRILPLTAAAVLAMSAITAGAVYFYEWNQTAKDRLGVDDFLAAQMVLDQTAKEETASAVSEGVEIRAIQAVSLDRYFYVLLSVTVPDGGEIDGNTIFETMAVESKTPFQGCIVNYVEGSFEGKESLWEAFLFKESGIDYEGAEAVITLKNLVQMHNAAVTGTVAEGEWKLSVTLPREQDLLVKEEEFDIEVGHHLLSISRQEISPFEIRLYGDMDEIRHALNHSAGCMVTGVRYQDGTVVDEEDILKYTKITSDPNGEGCICIHLNHAIEIGKYQSLIMENYGSLAEKMGEEEINGMELVYENKNLYDGHKILTDGKIVYLWDEQCLLGTKLLDLTEIGFDPGRGDAFTAGPGGNLLYVTLKGEMKAYTVEY